MSDPARKLNHAADVEGFLDTLFEGQEGFVYIPTKSPSTGAWQTYFFNYPEQRNDIITHAMDATKSKEVYLSPSLFTEPSISDKKDTWKGSNYVWTEFDGNAPKVLPHGVPNPSIRIQSSTPGHEHWYWRLSEFESNKDVVAGLSKQLTYSLDADKSAWDYKQVLRPPGTLHHDTKRRVRVLSRKEGTVSLSDFVGLVETPADVIVNTNIKDLPDIQDVISKFKFGTDARDLFKKNTQPTGSRSSAMMRMAFHCIEMGMNNEEAYCILLNCDDRWGKYKNRTPENRAKVLTGLIAHARNEKSIQAEKRLTDYEPMYTIDELLALDYSKISWLFGEVIAENSLTVLAADPDVGKTTFAIQMGLSVAIGKKFLNWDYGLQQGGINVGFFSYEMDARQCGHFLSTMLNGCNPAEKIILGQRFYIRPTGYGIQLDRTDEQQKFLDYVDQHELKFIIIDSLKAVGALDEKKTDHIMQFINKDLRNDRGCTVLVIHHNRKAPQEGRTGEQSLADLYGDVFIQATAVHVLGLRAKSNNKIEVAQVKNRLAPHAPTFRMVRKDHMAFAVETGEEIKDDIKSAAGKSGLSGGIAL